MCAAIGMVAGPTVAGARADAPCRSRTSTRARWKRSARDWNADATARPSSKPQRPGNARCHAGIRLDVLQQTLDGRTERVPIRALDAERVQDLCARLTSAPSENRATARPTLRGEKTTLGSREDCERVLKTSRPNADSGSAAVCCACAVVALCRHGMHSANIAISATRPMGITVPPQVEYVDCRIGKSTSEPHGLCHTVMNRPAFWERTS